MKLSELFEKIETNPDFEGWLTTDDMVLAVDITSEQNADIDDYAVAYTGNKDKSSSLNPEEKTTSYYYTGKSSIKTGNQRTIDFSMDRYIKDPFQDFAFSFDMKYAKGQQSIVKYAYFNTITGEGEMGSGTLIISDDGSGAPEEKLSVSGSIKKSGDNPEKLMYQGFGGYTKIQTVPNDWSSSFSNYYERKNGAFVKLTGTASPSFAEGKYYSKNADDNIEQNEEE